MINAGSGCPSRCRPRNSGPCGKGKCEAAVIGAGAKSDADLLVAVERRDGGHGSGNRHATPDQTVEPPDIEIEAAQSGIDPAQGTQRLAAIKDVCRSFVLRDFASDFHCISRGAQCGRSRAMETIGARKPEDSPGIGDRPTRRRIDIGQSAAARNDAVGDPAQSAGSRRRRRWADYSR